MNRDEHREWVGRRYGQIFKEMHRPIDPDVLLEWRHKQLERIAQKKADRWELIKEIASGKTRLPGD